MAYCCAARTGSASQLLASRALVASHLVCFADSALCASASASHSSLTVRRCCHFARPVLWCKVGGQYTGTASVLLRSVLRWGAVETPAFGISAGSAPYCLYSYIYCCGPIIILWWPGRALRRGGTGGYGGLAVGEDTPFRVLVDVSLVENTNSNKRIELSLSQLPRRIPSDSSEHHLKISG